MPIVEQTILIKASVLEIMTALNNVADFPHWENIKRFEASVESSAEQIEEPVIVGY